MQPEQPAHLGHEIEPVNRLGEGVSLFFPNTVGDDVGLPRKPARLGLACSIPQSLFSYAASLPNEVKKGDCHNRLLGFTCCKVLSVNPVAAIHFQ